MLIFCCNLLNAQQKDNWEYNMLRNMADHRTEGKTKFYKTISQANSIVGFTIPATYLALGLAEKNKSLEKKALYMAECMAVTQGSSFLLKTIIKRERPAIQDPTFIPVVNPTNYGFPSGHTSAAFSMATSFTLACPKWYVAVPAFAYASLVGYSRMYLGVHFPTDVFAGALLGAGSAWAMFRLNKWMHHSKQKEHAEKHG